MKSKWYIIQLISNYEQNVKESLENIEFEKGKINEIYLPFISNQMRSGSIKKRPMFPGYLYVNIEITDDSWYKIRNTEYVTGIVGSSGQRIKPTPISQEKIDQIKKREKEEIDILMKLQEENVGEDVVNKKINFKINDYVEIFEDKFKGQKAQVVDISIMKQSAIVKIEMFGRMTEVEIKIKFLKKLD